MHIKREPQDGLSFTSRISFGSNMGTATTATLTGILSDAPPSSALTTLLSSYEVAITQPATTLTSTYVVTSKVYDPAQYSSLKASESSSNALETHATSVTSANASETSNAAMKSSANNLSTLIPAIVVPIAVLLIASFAAFWFLMRRRSKRQTKEEPEFVMASKTEKPALSRGNSNSSGTSSTRELIPMSKLEKETAITTTHIRRSSFDLFPPKYSSAEIGIARPMTPPDKDASKVGEKTAVRNFSGVRPGTSHRSAGSRGQSISGTLPRGVGRTTPPQSTHGPSPTMRRTPPATRGSMGQPPRPQRPREADALLGARSSPRQGPSPISTNMNSGNRAPPPSTLLNPATPTGAFNGASPISQYSPIIKAHPNLGVITAANAAQKRSQAMSLSTRDPLPSTKTGTESPMDDENVLSHENMRIARLANSSRLGFNNSPIERNSPLRGDGTQRGFALVAEADPQVPAPLLKDELLHRPAFLQGPDSPAGASSTYPSPSIDAGETPRIRGEYSTASLAHSEHTIGVASTTNQQRHISTISQLSSDDGYADMEIDVKSDVSSLDEREKWEMQSGRVGAGSRPGTGYKGVGSENAALSPVEDPTSSAGTGMSKPGLRDRDSEGPFVLSRY